MNEQLNAPQLDQPTEILSDPQLSIVLPVYNELDNLVPLLDEIDGVLKPFGRSYEIIAVDDGSTDGSAQLLFSLVPTRINLRVVQLRRNSGQSAAFDAGFQTARGRRVITLDADGQNDPADIPRMIHLAEKDDLEFVSGIRAGRKDGFVLRKLPSKIANFLIRRVTRTKIRDLGCSLKLYDRAVIQDVRLYGEMHRFLAVLIEGDGARTGQINVNHRPRTRGVSKYGLSRTFKVVLDLMTVWFIRGFATKPIYVFGGVAILLFTLALLASAFVLYQRQFNGIFVKDQPLFIVGMVMAIMAVQFVAMGLLAEVLVRTYFESRNKPAYHIRKISP